MFALQCIWSYGLYSQVEMNLSLLQILVLTVFALCCCLNINLVRPVSLCSEHLTSMQSQIQNIFGQMNFRFLFF